MAAANNEIINWEEALQQCGDDEEFLHELLTDFRNELQTQLTSIAGTIQVRQYHWKMILSRKWAHAGEYDAPLEATRRATISFSNICIAMFRKLELWLLAEEYC